jgi:flagellar motor switch protein FliG
MSNLRQAAVLVANLPIAESAVVLAKLDYEHARTIRDEIARRVPARDELISAVHQFAQDRVTAKASEQFGLSELLSDVDDQTLLAALTDEHPQTIALVVGSLPRPRAVKLLGKFSAELQAALVRRIAGMSQLHPEMIREVIGGLQARVSRPVSGKLESRAA